VSIDRGSLRNDRCVAIQKASSVSLAEEQVICCTGRTIAPHIGNCEKGRLVHCFLAWKDSSERRAINAS